MQALFGIGAGIGTALVVSAILPLVEGAFQITTTISWLELADLNHPLLQQMTMEAPGTYHHSLLVANLAESGAKAIGLDADRVPRHGLLPRHRQDHQAGVFHGEHPARRESAREPDAEHERADHHRAREGGHRPRAEVPA